MVKMPTPGVPQLTISPLGALQTTSRLLQTTQNASLFCLLALVLATASCSSISAAQPPSSGVQTPTAANSGPTVSPNNAIISSGAKLQFTATVTNSADTAVIWSASAGTISSSGVFTAPKVSKATSVTVTATSAANPTKTATVAVTVQAGQGQTVAPLAIDTSSVSGAIMGSSYSAALKASGGQTPYLWTLASGTLPSGLTLSSGGALTGTPSKSGDFSFVVKASDSSNHQATQSYSLDVTGNTSSFDGPAELPRIYIQSALADTPAPGSTIEVKAGGDFQNALNSAKCGDTINLQAGAAFSGSFIVPAKNCDDAHWIIVRTSAPDSSLPPEGTRINPCYAGVASLPGRPAYQCAVNANIMAKIQSPQESAGPLVLQDGANFYRFIGVEITRTPHTGIVYNLVSHQNQGSADHVIFDRTWFHGTAQDETTRGVMLSGTTYGAVIDSYFSDFHCISRTGVCIDSQAIAGGVGDLAQGPYKIVDNFLEAAGECILLGGDGATTTPTDIEVRFNHMFKPMTWMKGQPGFVGGTDGNPFIVKNLFELKNAQRVLLEGNIMEDNWGGFTQSGAAVLLTPKNQAIGTGNVCPICQVTDVTIRYGTISHVAGALVMANGLSTNGGVPLAGERYSIHDLIADDIDGTKYNGPGAFAQVSMGKGAPVLQSVTINHVTATQPGVMLYLGDDIRLNPTMNNFVFTNNIVNAGPSATETIGGGTANCAYDSTPVISLKSCFEPYTFLRNAIVASLPNRPPSKYPSGNFFPTTAAAVQFVNYDKGDGGNYQLASTSPYRNAGTDGKDLGADVAAIQTAIAGVE
jgi:hypothetical protein